MKGRSVATLTSAIKLREREPLTEKSPARECKQALFLVAWEWVRVLAATWNLVIFSSRSVISGQVAHQVEAI